MKKKVVNRKKIQKEGTEKDPRTRRINPQEQQIRGIPLFPLAMVRKRLFYADTIVLASTSPAIAPTYVFSANSLYDPDSTGTGHQPIGFDQMMLSYDHYTVIRSKMTATFRSTNGACSAAIRLCGSSTPTTNPNQILEDGRVNRVHLSANPVAGYIQTLEQSVDIAKAIGVTDVRNEFELRGGATSNPAESEYFHVQIWELGPGVASIGASVDIFLEFEAWFSEPRDLSESLKELRELREGKYPPPGTRRELKADPGSTCTVPADPCRTDGVCACTVPPGLQSLPMTRQAADNCRSSVAGVPSEDRVTRR